jgi:putative thioredoxin
MCIRDRGQAEGAEDDVELQLAAADVEVGSGRSAAAFARLIGLVARTSGDQRERIRLRLLELFDTVEPGDPEVLKARRALTTALF